MVYDLLVIGGGINGAGIARDAAMRGLSVCIVDKNDWGWATSSKSSMLAHGGLRYLEQFEFGLVHEALQDRERMLQQAPHLVRPLRFLYPIYPEIAARRTVRAGLFLYDILSHGKSVEGRDYHSRKKVLAMAPGIAPEGLRGGATYSDGQILSVERLTWELIQDARNHGAAIHNHTRATLLLETVDTPTGATRRAVGARLKTPNGQKTIRARAVVNAAGTWVDDVLKPTQTEGSKVRKTKGIHIVVPRFIEIATIIKAKDGRVFFVIPWKDHCVIGTTDTDFEGDAGKAVATAEDVAYLLESVRRYFPDAPLDIRYTYAGVRALVNQEGLTESNVTRRHIIFDHAKKDGIDRLWTLQGGKITTYRTLAEETVNQIARTLGRPDLAREHPTRKGTLPGGPLVPWDEFRQSSLETARSLGLHEATAAHLIDVYGAQWQSVAEGDTKRIRKPLPHIWAEVDHAVETEDAKTLADVMLRRTDLGLAADGRLSVSKSVATRMARLLDWTTEEKDRQITAYARESSVFGIPKT